MPHCQPSQLIECLQSVADFRAARGRRYPLWVILLLAILGTLSGAQGYRALEDFCVRHYQPLCEHLELSCQRLPSDSTFRSVFRQVDFNELTRCFTVWAQSTFGILEGEWLALDGKSIGGTLDNTHESYQSFVSTVSVYSQQRGIVVGLQEFNNKEHSEIHVVQTLLESLNCQGVVFSMDALHTQKKRLKLLSKEEMTT